MTVARLEGSAANVGRLLVAVAQDNPNLRVVVQVYAAENGRPALKRISPDRGKRRHDPQKAILDVARGGFRRLFPPHPPGTVAPETPTDRPRLWQVAESPQYRNTDFALSGATRRANPAGAERVSHLQRGKEGFVPSGLSRRPFDPDIARREAFEDDIPLLGRKVVG